MGLCFSSKTGFWVRYKLPQAIHPKTIYRMQVHLTRLSLQLSAVWQVKGFKVATPPIAPLLFDGNFRQQKTTVNSNVLNLSASSIYLRDEVPIYGYVCAVHPTTIITVTKLTRTLFMNYILGYT